MYRRALNARPAGVHLLCVTICILLFASVAPAQNANQQRLPGDFSITIPNNQLFLPAVGYDSGGVSALSVVVGDVNGDGKLDVVSLSGCVVCGTLPLTGISVLLGNGDGTFQPAQLNPVGNVPLSSIALADLNGDGKLDIAVGLSDADFSGGFVGVLLGNGDGTFQPLVTYSSGGTVPFRVAVGDINGDGKPDMLVANQCAQGYCVGMDGAIGVLFGNGDGTFQAAQSYDSGGGASFGMAVADVNGDGKLDIVVANCGCDLSTVANTAVLLGNGDGTFQPARTVSPPPNGLYALAVADVNADGKLDLLETTCFDRQCDGGVAVLLGNGDGTFQPPKVYESGEYLPLSIVVADVNGDGWLDAILVNASLHGSDGLYGGVSVLLGNGDGTFAASAQKYSSAGSEGFSLALGDFNGDGRTDIVAANLFSVCDVSHNCEGGVLGVLLGDFKSPTATTFASNLSSSTYGQPVTWTATVTSLGKFPLAGTVKFMWGGTNTIGSATLNSYGVATLTKSNLNADVYPLAVVYVGDINNLKSTSAVMNLVVQPTTSAATITSSVNPSTAGQAVKFTVAISSPTVIPKGPVTFTAGKAVLGTVQLSSGKATLTVSSLPAGSTQVNVTYAGDSNIAMSSASLTQLVQP